MPNLPDNRDRADQLGGRGLRPAPGQVLGFAEDIRSARSASDGDNDVDSILTELHQKDIRSFQRNTNGTIEIELNDGSTIAGAKDLKGVRYQGFWSSSFTYVENDLVYRTVSSIDHWYIAIRDVRNNVQPGGSSTWTDDWKEVGAAGASGGGGLSTVNTDATITGDGSSGDPLKVANPFTDADETKLDGIAAGAEVNVQANWNQTSSSADDFIQNKPTIPDEASLRRGAEIELSDDFTLRIVEDLGKTIILNPSDTTKK